VTAPKKKTPRRATKKKVRKKTVRKKTPRKKAPARRTANPGGGVSVAVVSAVSAAAGAIARAACTAGGGVAAWLGAHAGRGVASLARSRDVQRIAALGLLSGALAFASYGVRNEVEGWPQFAIRADALSANGQPEGLSKRVSRDLERLPLPRPTSAFDRRLVPFTAALLADLQWVESVESVRLVPPRGLSFSVTTRTPVARVGRHVLTHDGMLMEQDYAAEPNLLPRVVGLSTDLLAKRSALRATVSVLDDLGALASRVKDIEVSGLGKFSLDSEICLVLDTGTIVDWGRPSCSDRSNLPGETKRAALEEFLERGPDLSTVESVSVRWDETGYVLKPASTLASSR
jgi:hypothetical protein